MKRCAQRITRLFSASDDEQGQILVIVTFAIVGFLALVGIVTDSAIVYVNYDHLRRSIDSAAVSAVNQYREGRVAQELYEAATQALQLQLPLVQNVRVRWCNAGGSNTVLTAEGETYDAHDASLCSVPPVTPRKRVQITAELPVTLTFLSLVWDDQVTLRGRAEAEAAVLNMVLLLDTSESMAYATCDESAPEPVFFACLENCRAAGNCAPFDAANPGDPSVRWAAATFVNTLMRDGVDRVAVYHFDKTPVISESVESFTCFDPPTLTFPVTLTVSSGVIIPLTTTKAAVLTAINAGQGNPGNPLNAYVRPLARDAATGAQCMDPSHVGGWAGEEGVGYGYRWASTNIGGGLRESVGELVRNGSTDAAIWVIVLLSDGAANATDQAADQNGWWSCPPTARNRASGPFCRDSDPNTRHCPSQEVCDRVVDPDQPALWYTNPGHSYQEWQYDAEDYARDIADLASSQQIAIYTVGFGPKVIGNGESLLRYIADIGDDGDLETAPCGSDSYWDDVVVDPLPGDGSNCGNYYFAPDPASLEDVFENIASRIFSRITQ